MRRHNQVAVFFQIDEVSPRTKPFSHSGTAFPNFIEIGPYRRNEMSLKFVAIAKKYRGEIVVGILVFLALVFRDLLASIF